MTSLSKVQSPDIDPHTLDLFKKYREQRKSFNTYMLAVKKSGEYFWVDVSILPLHDNQHDRWYFLHKIREVEEYELVKDRAKVMEWCDLTATMAKIGLWEWYPENDKAFFSESMYSILGIEPEKHRPSFELYKSFIVDEDREELVAKMNRVAEQGGEATQLHRIRREDTGEVRYLKGYAKRYEAESKILKLYGIVQDVTDYQEHLDQTRLFQQAVEASNQGIVITENGKKDNPIIYSNRQFHSMTGYAEGEIYGRDCRFLQGKDRQQEGRERVRNAINAGKPTQVTLRNYSKDGEMFWNRLSIAPIEDRTGEATHFVGIQENVTEQVSLKRDLESQVEFEEAIINSLPGIFTLLDENMQYIKWNKNFEKMTGYSREEVRNLKPIELIAEEDKERFAEAIELAYQEGENSVEVSIVTKHGESIPHYLAGRVFEKEGKTYLLGYGLDISKQWEYQEDLKELLEQKDTLIREIHHRVKNNMAIASGLLELQKGEMTDEVLQEALSKSQLRLKTMAQVHEQLYQQDELTDIESSKYLRDLVNMIREAYSNRSIEIEKDIDSFGLNVNQAVPLGLMLNELIINAYKYAYDEHQHGIIEVSLKLEDGMVKTSVTDYGRGLPDDFDVNTPRSLGYTIIQTLVKQLGANMDVDSSSKGASVCITFPRQELRGSASNIVGW
jgi:PAS domain S-box-containing protein